MRGLAAGCAVVSVFAACAAAPPPAGSATSPATTTSVTAATSSSSNEAPPTSAQLFCADGVLPEYPTVGGPAPSTSALPAGLGVGKGPKRQTLVGASTDAGGLRGRAIAEGACRRHDKVRVCYDDARKSIPSLAGTVSLALLIDATGRVTQAKRSAGDIPGPAFVACLESAFVGAMFPAKAEGAATWTLSFLGTELLGHLPPADIKRVVKKGFPRMRACYEAGLAKNPKLKGTVMVSFVIDPAGAVTGAHPVGGTLEDAGVADCVAAVFDTLSFPQPVGGAVMVRYPVQFDSE